MKDDKKETIVFSIIIFVIAVLISVLAIVMTQPITRNSKATRYDLSCIGTLEECKIKE